MTTNLTEMPLDPEMAAEMASKAVLHYLHACEIEGEEKKRAWIQHVFDRVVTKELAH